MKVIRIVSGEQRLTGSDVRRHH